MEFRIHEPVEIVAGGQPLARVDDLRCSLGEEAFARAWAQGPAMTSTESLAYALEEEADPEPT